MENIQESGYEIEVNGITHQHYLLAKQMWNAVYGSQSDSTDFLDYCASQWAQVKPLYNLSVRGNMPQLFEAVYRYYRDMTIVGAQVEWERIRGMWTPSSSIGVQTAMYLLALRMNTSSDHGPDSLVHDIEQEYYQQTSQSVAEPDSEIENA